MIQVATKNKVVFYMEDNPELIPVSEYLLYENTVKLRPTESDIESEIAAAQFIYDSVGFWGKTAGGERIGKAAETLDITDVTAVWKVISERMLKQSKPEYKESFEHKGETYYFPNENLKDSPLSDFINAQQLRHFHAKSNEKYKEILYIFASLVRKKNEPVFQKPEQLEQRVKHFEDVPMSEIFNFSFFLWRRKITSLKILRAHLRALQTQSGLVPEVIN